MSQHQGNWRIDHYTSTTTRKEQSRSGTTTSMVEEWSEPVSQDKIVSTSLIHTMRGRDIDIIGELFKPNTRYYCFFDNIDVNAYMTASAAAYDVLGAGTPVIGTGIKSDNVGKVLAIFSIPETDQLNFGTGRKTFKLTESPTGKDDVLSRGTAIYEATGRLQNIQEQITSTRNGKIIIEPLTEEIVGILAA